MSSTDFDEDDESLLRNLVQSAGRYEGDSSFVSRMEALPRRLLHDMTHALCDSRVFWLRMEASARKLGFSFNSYHIDEGFWLSAETENTTEVPRHFQSDEGSKHLNAVASLLHVSATRAAALTTAALAELNQCGSSSGTRRKNAGDHRIGSIGCILQVRDFYYRQQVARIRIVAEALRLQEPNSPSCERIVDTLENKAYYSDVSGETCRRGCFLILLLITCAPFQPLDRAHVDPTIQSATRRDDHQTSLLELLLTHEKHYDQNYRMEALELLMGLLYQHIDRGLQRRDLILLLLAFDQQNFFLPNPNSRKETFNNRNAILASLILAESTCLWRAMQRVQQPQTSDVWMDQHPLFYGDDVEKEWDVLFTFLQNISFNRDLHASRHSPQAMALLTVGLLLKLALLKSCQKYSFLQKWKDQVHQCLSIANDQYGVFDHLALILTALLPTNNMSLKRHDRVLGASYHTWEKFSIKDLESSLSIVHNSNMNDPTPSITYTTNIGHEIILATLSAFRSTIQAVNSNENITVLCQLTAIIYRNNAALCQQFWLEWTRYTEETFIEGQVYPICLLFDISYQMVTSILEPTRRMTLTENDRGFFTHKVDWQLLQVVSPFLQLFSSLIQPDPSIIGQILPSFLPDNLIATSLLCSLSLIDLRFPIAAGNLKDMGLYFELTMKILQSLQTLASLAAMTKSIESIHFLRYCFSRNADPAEAQWGLKMLFSLAINALKNKQYDQEQREVVASSCLSIIANLSTYFTNTDISWIHRVGVVLDVKGFQDLLFCGSDMVAAQAVFLLQKLCSSLIPFFFFSSLDDHDLRSHLKWMETSILSLFHNLAPITPLDYSNSLPSPYCMNLVFSSISCIYTFLKATDITAAYHASKEMRENCEKAHRNLLTVMNTSGFFQPFLIFHSVLPRVIGVANIKTAALDGIHNDVSIDIFISELSEDNSWLSSSVFYTVQSMLQAFMNDHEFCSNLIDNAVVAIHMLALWSEKDELLRANICKPGNHVEKAFEMILTYCFLDFGVNESLDLSGIFKAAVNFLMPSVGDPYRINHSLPVQLPKRIVSFKAIISVLLDDVRNLRERYDTMFEGKVFLTERVVYFLSLVSPCLDSNTMTLILCSTEESSLFTTLVSILECHGKVLGSFMDAHFVSVAMKTLVALWDVRQKRNLPVNNAPESCSDERLLSLCLTLLKHHVELKVYDEIDSHTGSLIYQLIGFCLNLSTRIIANARFTNLNNHLQLLKGFDIWLVSDIKILLVRLKESYQLIEVPVPRDCDWIGYIEKVGFSVGINPRNELLVDFHGRLLIATQFFMLLPSVSDLVKSILIRQLTDKIETVNYDGDNLGCNSSISSYSETFNPLDRVSSLIDPFLDLLSSDINVDRVFLSSAMSGFSSMSELLIFFICIRDQLSNLKTHSSSSRKADSVEVLVTLSRLSERLSYLLFSAEAAKSVQHKIVSILLTTSLKVMEIIIESDISDNNQMKNECISLARTSCYHIHNIRLHYTTSDKILSDNLIDLLQVSLAVVETIPQALRNDEIMSSLLLDWNLVEDVINLFILLSEAIELSNMSSISQVKASASSSRDILSVISSIINYLQLLAERYPLLFLGKHYTSIFLKSRILSLLLPFSNNPSIHDIALSHDESNSIMMDDLHRVFITVIHFLSTLLRNSRLIILRTRVSSLWFDFERLVANVFDFLRSIENKILIIMNDTFTVGPIDGNTAKLTSEITLSCARSAYAPSFTVHRLKGAREILSLFNELFHSKSLSDLDKDMSSNFLSATLTCIKSLSLFLGSISHARELFSLLRMVDNSLRRPGLGSSHLHDAMTKHPVLSEGIPYARSQAITYAHFASSCCISLSKEDVDMRNHLSSAQRKVSYEDSIDQSYENGINNMFILKIEELAMECIVLGLLIVDLTHCAGSLIVLSPGEAVRFSDASLLQSSVHVSYLRKESSIQSFGEPCESIKDQVFGSILNFNAIRNTVDVRCVVTNLEEKDISCSRLVFIEDIRKRKNVFKLGPAPRSFSTLISNLLYDEVSLGHLILVLQWCKQKVLAEDSKTEHSLSILKYLAQSSALLLGSEIHVRMDSEAFKTVDDACIKDIVCQLKELFQEGPSDTTTRSQSNSLKSIMDIAVWTFVTDVMNQMFNKWKV